MRDIVVALIAATPTTIASVAALVKVLKMARATEQINSAVNHQPKDQPRLIERVIDVQQDVKTLHASTTALTRKVASLEKAQQRHAAWHQAQTENGAA